MARTLILAIGAATVLLAPAAAQAHVSLHPNVVPEGAFATLDIRVPNEQDNATTTKLAVEFPPGFLDVATQPPPGWRSKVVTVKLATPVKTDEGTIDTQVHEVIWTVGHGAGIPPGQFANFPISVAIPGKEGDTLTFKTVQTYSNGQVVRWIGTPDSEQPAPTIDVSAKGGVLQDVAGGEAGPGPQPEATTATPAAGATATKVVKESSSNGLAIGALVVAGLALVAGVAALVTGRRARARA